MEFKGMDLIGILVMAAVAVGFLLFVMLIVARLYRRATKEVSP